MPIQLSYLGCSEKDHIIYRQIHFISCISLYLHTVLWRYQLFTPQGVLCPYGPYHGSIARAASRPNYRWTLRINTLHSRCSDDNRPVQFLAALSQSYPADYLHQCILQLIRLYRYDDLAQRAWCRKWFSFVPVSGVLSPDVRPEFGNPIIIYIRRDFDKDCRFPLADVLWTLATAINVFLVVFYQYDAESLRKLEKVYIVVITALVFIPALVFLFINTSERGPMYSSVTVSVLSQNWGQHEW